MKRPLSHFVLGAILGVGGTVAVRHATASAASERNVAPAVARLPEPSPAPWTPPTVLAEAEAGSRVDAWLAGDLGDRAGLLRLLAVLPASEFAGLAEGLLALSGGDACARFQDVFDAWVDRDAASAARWAGALPEKGSLNGRARRLLRERAGLAWARDDLDAALLWAHALPDAGAEWGAAAMIYGQLAERDPRRAIALAQARGDDAFYAKAARRIYDGWAKRDPGAALQGLGGTLLGGGMNFLSFANDIGRWIGQDSSAAFAWVIAQDRGNDTYTRSLFANLDDKVDPAVLVPGLFRATQDAAHADWFGDSLKAWMQSDPGAAKAWLASVGESELGKQILVRAAGSHNPSQPWVGLDLVLLLPSGAERNRTLASRVSAWFELDPDGVVAWLAQHDEPAVAFEIQGRLIGRLAATDRPAALARLAALEPGQEKRTATRQIAAAWAKSSPAEAAEWLAGATRSKTESYNHQDWGAVVDPWFAQDPAAVRDWINSQADPALREEAGTAWTIELLNCALGPAERCELILGVKDEARQRQDMLNLTYRWFKDDPDAARAWLAASALPQTTKDVVSRAYDPAVKR